MHGAGDSHYDWVSFLKNTRFEEVWATEGVEYPALAFFTFGYGQNDITDIKVYNSWSTYKDGKWSEWKANDEVFILNYKGSKNVARCRLNNKITVLKTNPEIPFKEGKTSDAYTYKLLTVYELIPSIKMELKFFDNNPNYGMELKYGSINLRFRKH